MGRKKFLVSFRFKRLINLITRSGKQVTRFSITPYYGRKAKNSYEQSCNLRKSLSHLNFVLVTLRIWDFMEDMKFISGVKGARSLS